MYWRVLAQFHAGQVGAGGSDELLELSPFCQYVIRYMCEKREGGEKDTVNQEFVARELINHHL